MTGGWIATRAGDRAVGLCRTAYAYGYLFPTGRWDLLADRHNTPVPAMHTDLVVSFRVSW